MQNSFVADYSSAVRVPDLAEPFVDRRGRKRIPINLERVQMLPLSTSPGRPPYFNFSDFNAIWRFKNSQPSGHFFDVWIAKAIAEISKSRDLWAHLNRIYCPETVIYLDGIKGDRKAMPVLNRVERRLEMGFIFNFRQGQLTEFEKQTSAIGYLIPESFSGLAPPRTAF